MWMLCMLQEGRICLMTELMDTSLMSALLLPDDANKEYHYFNQSVPWPLGCYSANVGGSAL